MCEFLTEAFEHVTPQLGSSTRVGGLYIIQGLFTKGGVGISACSACKQLNTRARQLQGRSIRKICFIFIYLSTVHYCAGFYNETTVVTRNVIDPVSIPLVVAAYVRTLSQFEVSQINESSQATDNICDR